MASNPSQGKGLSLYANLLGNASAPGTITSAPVLYNQNDAQKKDEKKNVVNPAFRFQPTKRPQQPKAKKTAFPRAPFPTASSSSPDKTPAPPVRTTLADWTRDDDDVNGFYTAGNQRPRGGRRKKKKQKEEEPVIQNWDDIYDPSRPNVFQDYKHSDEKYRSIGEWKDRLYAHRKTRSYNSDGSSEENRARQTNGRFAPPSNYNFAPPKNLDPSSKSPAPSDDKFDAITAEDAYAQRIRPSQAEANDPRAPSPTEELSLHVGLGAVSSQSDLRPTATISRAPVRYNVSAASPEAASNESGKEETGTAPKADAAEAEEDAPRNNRPGQKGFGQRMMAKMGYVKGKGLGANEDGIITALQVKPEKRKKLSDAEGGGFADRGGKGRIIGGKRAKGTADEENAFGPMSEVVVVWGMIDGVDLEEDSNRNDGGVRQEIGDACRAKYGNVEKVQPYGQSDNKSTPVYIKFTNQLYAFMAVQDFNKPEHRFNGREIKARFFDADKFEQGEYE